MMITPVTGTNVFIIRYRSLYWKLTGPAAHHVTPGWRVWVTHFNDDNWPITAIYPTKWEAIAALLRVINKPWTY